MITIVLLILADGEISMKNNNQRLGSAGLALHYANIITQIDTIVSISCLFLKKSTIIFRSLAPSIFPLLPSHPLLVSISSVILWNMGRNLFSFSSKLKHLFGDQINNSHRLCLCALIQLSSLISNYML